VLVIILCFYSSVEMVDYCICFLMEIWSIDTAIDIGLCSPFAVVEAPNLKKALVLLRKTSEVAYEVVALEASMPLKVVKT